MNPITPTAAPTLAGREHQVLVGALDFLIRGMSVAPLRPGEKSPPIPWKRLQDAPPSVDEVEDWYARRFRGFNVALITGKLSRAVVCDCDSPAARAWMDANVPATTLRVTTGREGGGEHRYYRYPELDSGLFYDHKDGAPWIPGKNGAHVPPSDENPEPLRLKLDVKADGNLVVAPPSFHKTGRQYRVAAGGAGADASTCDLSEYFAAIEQAPVFDVSWFDELCFCRLEGGRCRRQMGLRLAEAPPADPARPPRLPSTTGDLSSAARRARAYIQKMGPSIEGQNGDDHLIKVAYTLIRDFALPEDLALEILLEWNQACVPPWSERDLRTKVASARRGGRFEVGRKLADRLPPRPDRGDRGPRIVAGPAPSSARTSTSSAQSGPSPAHGGPPPDPLAPASLENAPAAACGPLLPPADDLPPTAGGNLPPGLAWDSRRYLRQFSNQQLVAPRGEGVLLPGENGMDSRDRPTDRRHKRTVRIAACGLFGRRNECTSSPLHPPTSRYRWACECRTSCPACAGKHADLVKCHVQDEWPAQVCVLRVRVRGLGDPQGTDQHAMDPLGALRELRVAVKKAIGSYNGHAYRWVLAYRYLLWVGVRTASAALRTARNDLRALGYDAELEVLGKSEAARVVRDAWIEPAAHFDELVRSRDPLALANWFGVDPDLSLPRTRGNRLGEEQLPWPRLAAIRQELAAAALEKRGGVPLDRCAHVIDDRTGERCCAPCRKVTTCGVTGERLAEFHPKRAEWRVVEQSLAIALDRLDAPAPPSLDTPQPPVPAASLQPAPAVASSGGPPGDGPRVRLRSRTAAARPHPLLC